MSLYALGLNHATRAGRPRQDNKITTSNLQDGFGAPRMLQAVVCRQGVFAAARDSGLSTGHSGYAVRESGTLDGG